MAEATGLQTQKILNREVIKKVFQQVRHYGQSVVLRRLGWHSVFWGEYHSRFPTNQSSPNMQRGQRGQKESRWVRRWVEIPIQWAEAYSQCLSNRPNGELHLQCRSSVACGSCTRRQHNSLQSRECNLRPSRKGVRMHVDAAPSLSPHREASTLWL